MSRVLPSASLQNKQGGSDKVYNCEIISTKADQYLVNFSYGRRGSTLKAGTKTAAPVSYKTALSAFEKLVKSKQKKGYVSSGDPVQGGVALSTDTVGFFPQLLNPITPEDIGSALCRFGEIALQEKFDGERRLASLKGDTLTFANRSGCVVTPPAEMAADRKRLMIALRDELGFLSSSDTLILDGEDMGRLIICFDVVVLCKERGFTQETFRQRGVWISALNKICDGGSSHLQVSEPLFTRSSAELADFISAHKSAKSEGVVVKNPASPYSSGRPASGGNALKLKFWESATVLVSEITPHKRSVRLCVSDGNKNLDVGAVSIPANATIPLVGQLVEVRYLYYFAGGSLFQPTFLGLRTDLPVESACLSQLKLKA